MTPLEEKTNALEAKVQKYEEILEQMINQAPKQTGKVTAGPFEDDEKIYYRVSVGGNSIIATFSGGLYFDQRPTVLDEGTEVVVQAGQITAIVPKVLLLAEPTLPTFNLVTWADIGGLKSQMEDIRDMVELPIKHNAIAAKLGLPPMKGILLYGPSGCGKTLIAKAIASTILSAKTVDSRAFVYIKGAELLDKFVGETEKRIADIFRNAREYTRATKKRAIVFIDEAEALMGTRNSGHLSMSSTVVPTFLAEMDGFDGDSPFVLLSTNLPQSIDPAILREGRIDLKVEIKRPTEDDVKDIFQIHLSKSKCFDKVEDLALAGSKTLAAHPQFEKVSGGMVETIVKFSIQKVLKRIINDPTSPEGIILKDLDEAFKMLN